MSFTGTILRRGSMGAEVRLVQGVLGVQQTGTFGPTTEENVSRFQRAHGLEVDGQVGPKTWAVLFAPLPVITPNLGLKALELARAHQGEHEQPLGSNRGPLVNQWNSRAGVPLGSAWCASFAYSMVDDAARELGLANPLPRTGSSSALFNWARQHGRLLPRPEAGCIFLLKGGDTGHSHTGFGAGTLAGSRFPTVEGNSNNDGSTNGFEVVHRVPGRTLASCDYVRL